MAAVLSGARHAPIACDEQLSATAIGAGLALLGAFSIRQRLLRGRRRPLARYVSELSLLGKRTRLLAALWTLDCLAALAGAGVAPCAKTAGVSIVAGAALCLLTTPPKLVTDADIP